MNQSPGRHLDGSGAERNLPAGAGPDCRIASRGLVRGYSTRSRRPTRHCTHLLHFVSDKSPWLRWSGTFITVVDSSASVRNRPGTTSRLSRNPEPSWGNPGAGTDLATTGAHLSRSPRNAEFISQKRPERGQAVLAAHACGEDCRVWGG